MTTIKPAGRVFFLMEPPPSRRNQIHLLHRVIRRTGTTGSKGSFVLPLPCQRGASCQRGQNDFSKSFLLHPPLPSPPVNKETAFASKLCNIFLLRGVESSQVLMVFTPLSIVGCCQELGSDSAAICDLFYHFFLF